MEVLPLTHPLAFERLADARRGGTIDVLGAAIAIATHANPTLKPGAIEGQIDRMAQDVRYMLEHENPLPQSLRHVIFERHGLEGDRKNYSDPANSYIDRVLERRKGLPILLSLVYVETARRVGARAHGIGLPGHFVAALDVAGSAGQVADEETGGERLYVDAYNKGVVLSHEDCRKVAEGMGAKWREGYLDPIEPLAWVMRILANLRDVYGKREDASNLGAALEQMIVLDGGDAARREELAEVYRRLGRTGGAE